jgi:transcriptional regulator with XRE-family HTH domain
MTRAEVECVIRLAGIDYELVPRANERKANEPSRSNEPALKSAAIAKQLRAARKRAGLTQRKLAERLNLSHVTVAHAELGRSRVGERYLETVLAACGVASVRTPEPVSAEEAEQQAQIAEREHRLSLPRGWLQNPIYCAGIDPKTLQPVVRGSPRDLELRQTYPRWHDIAEVDVYG